MPDSSTAERHTVTLVLRPPAAASDVSQQLLAGTYDVSSATQASISADPADVKTARDFIQRKGLQVVAENADARTIHASGTAAQLESAFGYSMTAASGGEGSVESLDSPTNAAVPAELSGSVIAVLGMNQRPVARHHSDAS